jgi:hypothetical protein
VQGGENRALGDRLQGNSHDGVVENSDALRQLPDDVLAG